MPASLEAQLVKNPPALWDPYSVPDSPSGLPSPTAPPSLQSVTVLAYSLDASPCAAAVVLYYCAFPGALL